MHPGRLLRRVVGAQGDAAAIIVEGRESDDVAPGHLHLQQFGEGTESPASEAGQGLVAGGRRRCGGTLPALRRGPLLWRRSLGRRHDARRLEAGRHLVPVLGPQFRQVAGLADDTAVLVLHTEVHEAVGVEVLRAEALHGQLQGHPLFHEALEHLDQRLVRIEITPIEALHEGTRALGHGLQAVAVLLGHGLQQGHHLLFQQAGHQPLAAVGRHLVEHGQGHRQGHAVVGLTRRVQVGELELLPQHLQAGRKAIGGDALRVVAHELVAGELQGLGFRLFGALAPGLEAGQVEYLRGQLGVVEGVDQLLVHQHVGAPGLVLQALDLGHQAAVVGQEGHAPGRAFGDLALDQAFADEQLAAQGRVDLPVAHPTPRIHGEAVQGAALPGPHCAAGLGPVGLGYLALEQVITHLLQPLRLDAGEAAGKQARGIHQLGAHDPLAGLFGDGRTRVWPELDAAGTQVAAGGRTRGILDLAAHVAHQAGEQGLVDGFIAGRLIVLLPAVFGAQGV